MKRAHAGKVRPRPVRNRGAKAPPASAQAPPAVLGLQSLIGNRAVASMLRRNAGRQPGIPVRAALQSSGRPLDDGTRAEMEQHFGEDLDTVRVHSGPRAAATADAANALAFTVGDDVVFNQGQVSADRADSEELLTHELAHVVQQRRGGQARAGSAAPEQSAAKAAADVAGGAERVDLPAGSMVGMARQDKPETPGPKVGYVEAGEGLQEVQVDGVGVIRYPKDNSLQDEQFAVAIGWTTDEPGTLNIAIRRKTTTPVRVDQAAMSRLAALGYNKVVINEYPIPVDLREHPGPQFRPLPPPEARPKPKPKPKAPPPKIEAKPPDLPPLPAPDVDELPQLPPPELHDVLAPPPPPPPTLVQPVESDIVPPPTPHLETIEPPPPVRTPEELIDDHTSWLNLDEQALGADLLKRALRSDPDYVQRVIDSLGSTDQDDVSLAFAEAATDEQLRQLAGTPEGRRLLDRLFDELTAGEVFEDEQKQADRILAIKTKAVMTAEVFAKGLEKAKSSLILPYRKPGITVLTPSPIYARRLPDGKIAVHLRFDIFGTDYFYDRDLRLPSRIWDEVILDETDVVGVKFYDEGGTVGYFPALYLLQLENESTRVALEKAGEAFGTGLTFGFGGEVAAGAETVEGLGAVSTVARVGAAARTGLIWADRIALTLDLTNSVIQEHRGWIIETWPDQGREFVTSLDQITAYVRIYGLARGGVGLVQLGNGLRKNYANWRAAVRAAKELDASDLENIEQVGKQTEALLQAIDDAEKAGPPAVKPAVAGTGPPPPDPESLADTAAKSPIRSVVQGEGQTTAAKTGHLKVVGGKKELTPAVNAAEELEEAEQELRAVSGDPRAVRRVVAPKKAPKTVTTTAGGTVGETTEAVPKKGGGRGGGGSGTTGKAIEKKEIKRYVAERLKEQLQGHKPDPTEFLTFHEQVTIRGKSYGGNSTFNDIAEGLNNSSTLRQQGLKPALPLDPKKVDALLKEGQINFIKRNADLSTLYDQLDRLAKGQSVPELEALQLSPSRLSEIREELEALQVRRIGNMRTDITEVWFDTKRVEIADISLRENDPLHEFKTLLYKHIMEEMLPGFTVRAQDIKPTPGNYFNYLFKLVGE